MFCLNCMAIDGRKRIDNPHKFSYHHDEGLYNEYHLLSDNKWYILEETDRLRLFRQDNKMDVIVIQSPYIKITNDNILQVFYKLMNLVIFS